MVPEFKDKNMRMAGLGRMGPLLPGSEGATAPSENIFGVGADYSMFGMGDYDSGMFGMDGKLVITDPMSGLGQADMRKTASKWAPVLASAGGAIASTLFVNFKEGMTMRNAGFGILALGLGITAILGVMDATS